MATTKTLNTRIQLKYDSYANWTTNNPTLLQGELAIAYLGPTKDDSAVTPNNETHPVLFKVGPGQFNSLPWASALAADVHSWAKAATKPEYKASEIKELDTYISGKVQDTDLDTRYSFEVTADGKLQVSSTLYTLGVAGATTVVGTYDFVTPEELTAILNNYYTKTEADAKFAPIGIDTGVHSVSLATGTNDKTLKLTVDGVETDNIEVKNIYSKSEVDTLIRDAKQYADNNDANETFEISYDSASTKIKLTGSNGTNSEIDATDFIKDGMIESVALSDDGKSLVITWNTDADKEPSSTTIALTALVDVYTGKDGDYVKVAVSSTNEISADLTDTVKTSLAKADTAVQPAALNDYQPKGDYQPAGNYKTKQAAVADPTESGNTLSFIDSISQDENGVITATKKAVNLTNYVTKAEDKDTTYSAKADGGLKLEGTEFAIDDSITFIFNCGSSNTVMEQPTA